MSEFFNLSVVEKGGQNTNYGKSSGIGRPRDEVSRLEEKMMNMVTAVCCGWTIIGCSVMTGDPPFVEA